jgi:CheY-like chemotaxis protein
MATGRLGRRRRATLVIGDMSSESLAKRLQPGEPPAAAARVPGGRPADAPLVLVVEDDDGVRELAGAILREAGYRVLEAETGQRAMMLFEENADIRLIFTDIMVPGIDGFKLADMTKFRRPEVKILYATAFIDQVREKLGVVHGEVLVKPYRAAQLEQMVKHTLR